jgi:hypothetical protein
MRTVKISIYTLVLLIWFGCSGRYERDTLITGFSEVKEMPEVLLTYTEEEHSGHDRSTILKQCEINEFGDSFSTIGSITNWLIDLEVQISDNGRKGIYKGYAGADYSDIIIYVLEKRDGDWVKNEIEPFQMSNRICSYAISPDGNWGLFASTSHVVFRDKGNGTYKTPVTTVYLLNLNDYNCEKIPGFRRNGAFGVLTITSGEVLAYEYEDVIDYYGYPNTYLDSLCAFDADNPDKGPEYVHTFDDGFLNRLKASVVYSDNRKLKLLQRFDDYTAYMSYAEGSEIVEEIFRTDIDFVDACTDRNGDWVAGIAESEKAGEYELYLIDTVEKEYAKYPLDIDRESVNRINLIRLHEVKND